MPRWWHDHLGREWLDILPPLVADQCRRWGLDVEGDPSHGSNALVVPVRRHSEQFVLRLSPPGDDVTQEAAALQPGQAQMRSSGRYRGTGSSTARSSTTRSSAGSRRSA